MADYPLQSARQVAYRALCLGALLKRHSLEMAIQNIQDLPDEIREGWKREHEGVHHHLKKWVREEKILGHFSDDERLLWDAELGDWQQLDRAKIYWRCESLGMLLWAMTIVEAPYYDTQFDIEALLSPLDLMSPTIDFVWMASLREAEVVHQARDLAMVWHWRAMAHRDNADQDIIRQKAESTYNTGNLPEVKDDDFPVLGKAYCQLEDDEYKRISSLAKERHYALNWLCRQNDSWDDVSIELPD